MARVRCPACRKRQGESTITINGDKCVACGADVALLKFQREFSYRMSVGLSSSEQATLFNLAREVGSTPVQLIEAAVISRFFSWSNNTDQLKKDLMLVKLARDTNGAQ